MQKAVADPNRRTPPDRAGARAFRNSRLTALALIVLVPYALWLLVSLAGRDLALVRGTLAQPVNASALLALVVVGVFHMWLGMREILEDYVRKPGLGVWLTANTLFCLAMVAATGGALLKLWLGS